MRLDHPAFLVLAAVLVAAPTVAFGFFMDDWWHVVVAETRTPPEALLAMFDFASASDGFFAFWWRADDFMVRFFRPLSAALVLLDHAAFGRWAVGWHLHQVAWWVALVVLVRALFDDAIGRGAGALAAFAFVLDDGHLGPFGWLASRQALVSAVFSLAALRAHLRWRGGEPRWLPVSVVAWILAFLGGEGALGGVAYLVAWEALAAGGTPRERATALAPTGLVVAAWALVYRLGGFGVRGSGWYHDPGAEPIAWSLDAPGRALVLLGQLTLRGQVDAALVPDLYLGLVVTGLIGLACWAALLVHLRRDDPAAFGRIRWLLVGMLLSLVPVLSALPAARLLVMPSIGGAAAVGVVVDHVIRRRFVTPRLPWTYRWLTLVVAGIVYVVSPAALLGKGLLFVAVTGQARDLVGGADLGPPGAVVVVVAAPDSAFLPGITGMTPDRRKFGVLSIARHDLRVRRTALDRLEVEVVDGHLMGTAVERLFRGPTQPLVVGDGADWGFARIEVLAVDDVGPTRIAVTIDGGLATPAVTWRTVTDGALVPFVLPDVGEERVVHVPPAGL